MSFDRIKAQKTAVATLRRALERGRVAHAYLFEGPSGVGKAAAANALAQALLCPEAPRVGCGRCATCERVQAGKHPDVRWFAPRDEGNRNLPVELVRSEVLPFTKFAPFEASAACLIFPEADVSFPDQHQEAANALLKTLEEPRAQLTFMLLSERPERLLPTIRSRCQTVRFAPLPSAALREILTEQGVPETDQPAAVALAQGRADRARSLASDGRAQALVELALRVDRATAAGSIAPLLELSEELASHDERGLILDALALYYRDVAASAIDPARAPEAFPEHAPLINERAARLGSAAAAMRVQNIFNTGEALERNANAQTALDALFLGFLAAMPERVRLPPRPGRSAR